MIQDQDIHKLIFKARDEILANVKSCSIGGSSNWFSSLVQMIAITLLSIISIIMTYGSIRIIMNPQEGDVFAINNIAFAVVNIPSIIFVRIISKWTWDKTASVCASHIKMCKTIQTYFSKTIFDKINNDPPMKEEDLKNVSNNIIRNIIVNNSPEVTSPEVTNQRTTIESKSKKSQKKKKTKFNKFTNGKQFKNTKKKTKTKKSKFNKFNNGKQ